MKEWLVENEIFARLPGWLAKALMIFFTAFWSYWSSGELYHEGWWGPWYNPLFYLIPAVIFMTLTLVSLRWPKVGGAIIVVFGIAAGIFFDALLFGGIIALLGVFFWLEGRRRAHQRALHPDLPVAGRHWVWLTVIPPALIFSVFSAYMLPIVLTRVDDGDRSARVIAGNESPLLWAPEGPGWNWKQPWGGYPSWDSVALYGLAPIGMDWKNKPGYGYLEDRSLRHATAEDMARSNLCLYLSADGLTLLEEPQNIWRMPSVDDYVRAFARHGVNAGCAWHGEYMERVPCDVFPDKETPLWAPDLAPIYYWAAEEYDEQEAYFVSYNGFINSTRKSSGNPRHSYRCVREITDTE